MNEFENMGSAMRGHRKFIGASDIDDYLAAQGIYSAERPRRSRANDLRDAIRGIGEVQANTGSDYLVKGWLDQGRLSVTYGAANVGKSYFALSIALHIATGTAWAGCRVRQGGVVYLAAEGGRGFGNRIEAMRREYPELVRDADFRLLPACLDLHAGPDAGHFVNAVHDRAPAIVFIDTLARSMGDGDENAAKDMGRVIRSADEIRASLGCHVMLIHHSGKDAAKGARGSGALRAAADTELELTRDGDTIFARATKQRDMEAGGEFAFRLRSVEIGTDEDGDPVTSAVVEPVEAAKRKPKVTGQAAIALQALDDAVANEGRIVPGDMHPDNRKCVTLETWKTYCSRHSLTDAECGATRRSAFFKAKTKLQEKGLVRIVDELAWRVFE